MLILQLLFASILAPFKCLASPASHLVISNPALHDVNLHKRDNLCSLKTPPVLCQPKSSVTIDETALRAYNFFRAFVVDGDPKTMFSFIDSTYKVGYHFQSVSITKHHNTLDREEIKLNIE
jgi:hypothetical protein